MISVASIADYVQHYDSRLSHHRAWLRAVLERLTTHEPQALEEGGQLRRIWNSSPPAAVAVALPLVKDFEGCRLTAYPDPATGSEPWTIGWGTTVYYDGQPVRQGQTISQQLADDLLEGRLERDWFQLSKDIPSWPKLNPNQQAALLSFSYNCGAWYGTEGFNTLTSAIRDQRHGAVPGALMLYVNPGTPAEAGLRRRRKAEGALWSAALVGQGFRNPLPHVPYYSQRDSAQLAQRDRTCFSSSCAMLLESIKPGTLQGPNGDDQYLGVVQRFGDTTSAAAQIQALAHYGVRASFVKNADFQLIRRQIDSGMPVPCGYLHRGPVQSPSGSGHWLIVYGYTTSHIIVHDPWGEPDLLTGETLSSNGKGLRFTRQNFGMRWMVETVGYGAYRHAPGKGWAIVADA
jgi:GH24 family phage-related lysozyme (muramidase)